MACSPSLPGFSLTTVCRKRKGARSKKSRSSGVDACAKSIAPKSKRPPEIFSGGPRACGKVWNLRPAVPNRFVTRLEWLWQLGLDSEGSFRAFSDHAQGDRFCVAAFSQLTAKFTEIMDALPVDFRDDVARLQPSLRGRRVFFHFGNQHSLTIRHIEISAQLSGNIHRGNSNCWRGRIQSMFAKPPENFGSIRKRHDPRQPGADALSRLARHSGKFGRESLR